ncbi:hypothetical protein M6B38_206405 [Iris pallida]|uniref:Uncharacterized protein n=1 Tax=Iris pallida TaxID=29817 RepID=A0AAX6E6M8_IRIPA|nr:hypothetical protein M6B38_206405 [Iris pallida]
MGSGSSNPFFLIDLLCYLRLLNSGIALIVAGSIEVPCSNLDDDEADL